MRPRSGIARYLLSLGLLSQLANAADLDGFQVWGTLGAATGFQSGAFLLDVARTPDGSIVRLVFAGTGDFPCHRGTVMAWQKRITGKTPRDLAHPAKLCDLSQSKLYSYSLRSKILSVATEGDSKALVIQCGERRRVLNLPVDVAKPNNPYAGLWSRVMAVTWGDHVPDWTVVDPAAERDGQEFVEIARKWNYESYEPFTSFRSEILGYRGPIGKIVHDWHIETGTNLRLRQFVEPRGYELGVGPSESFSLPFRLTLDRASGKVLKSEPLVSWNGPPQVRPVWGASLQWVFEPPTVPQDGVADVTVTFRANCSGRP
jgi:hypothetical protein